MGWISPGEEPNKTSLEDKDDANSGSHISLHESVVKFRAHRELKRRKLVDIKGMLKPGRPIYFEDLLSGGKSRTSSMFSDGMTCCKSLQRC